MSILNSDSKNLKQNIGKIIINYSYLLFSICIFSIEVIKIYHAQWVYDFWEHSAVVNELTKNFFSPTNPIINTDTPHAFFTPYSLLVALFSKVTKLNSIQSLEYFGAINLIFFLFSFYLFCKSLFKERYVLGSTLSLFLVLIFHGKDPIIWSGFFHIIGNNGAWPYPSTFAMSIVFFILSIIANNEAKYSFLTSLLVVVLSAIAFITHPPTGIFLYIAIIVMNFSFNNYSIKQCIIKSILIVPSFLLCLLWPYFSMLDLLLANNIDFHNSNKTVYSEALKAWPILLALPALLIKKNKGVNYLLLTNIALILVFSLSYFLEIYTLSRLQFNVQMFAHILIAFLVVNTMNDLKKYSRYYLTILFICVVTSMYSNERRLRSVLYAFKAKEIKYYHKYEFLRDKIESNSIVLSDSETNWIIPSFNGKVISSKHPIYGINDIYERRRDVESFFKKETPDSLRHFLINKYSIDYILIDNTKVNFDSTTVQWINSIGKLEHKESKLELFRLNK